MSGDLTPGNGERTHIPKAFVDRYLLPPDAQRLVQISAHEQNVGGLTPGNGKRTHLPKAFVDRYLLFLPDAQRLV